MIVATHVIFALVIALTLSIIFGIILHREEPRSGFFLFFLMIFLFTLAGGLWVKPFGPAILGVFWLPMITIGLFGALFLYYRAPRTPPHNREETIEMLERIKKSRQLEKITFLTIDLLFWIMLVLLGAAILLYFLKGGMNAIQSP